MDTLPQDIIQAYVTELGEVQEAAIRLRNDKRLTNANLVTLATMLDREFQKPMNEWTCTPMQLFNKFLVHSQY